MLTERLVEDYQRKGAAVAFRGWGSHSTALSDEGDRMPLDRF